MFYVLWYKNETYAPRIEPANLLILYAVEKYRINETTISTPYSVIVGPFATLRLAEMHRDTQIAAEFME